MMDLSIEPTPALDQDLGGKAAVLSYLGRKRFPVPENMSLLKKPASERDWDGILTWWKILKMPPLAVRSSAKGEDGGSRSFAGQFQTFLNIKDERTLREAVENCFASVERANIAAYAAASGVDARLEMRVLLQKMVEPVFAGVYFSTDPNAGPSPGSGWLIEAVAGLGEQLVSGAQTPARISATSSVPPLAGWRPDYAETIRSWGERAKAELGYEVDMEWAIDAEGKFWVLQARPITTVGEAKRKTEILEGELARIRAEFGDDAAWDGQVFSEWTGVPSEMSFGIWAQAFQKGGAFDLALREVGFAGLRDEDGVVLDRLFGRGYLNLRKVERAYFGASPYRIELDPRPHLVFSASRITAANLLRAPVGIYKMMKVAWALQSNRKAIASRAAREAVTPPLFDIRRLGLPDLIDAFQFHAREFATSRLKPTMLLTLLIESTVQGLIAYLQGECGEREAWHSVQETIGAGLHSVASEMHAAYLSAAGDSTKWRAFTAQFGHRGFGELELAHPRWSETSAGALPGGTRATSLAVPAGKEARLTSKYAWKAKLVEQELASLNELLRERERIKMEVMRSYAQLRWMLLKIAELAAPPFQGSGNQLIFWLRPEELNLLAGSSAEISQAATRADARRRQAEALKTFELPLSFSRSDLAAIWSGDFGEKAGVLHGLALASGLVRGRVHLVSDPETERPETWPEDTVLVAEATDPGWTPLFRRAKALVVARGGSLSHCAIVARELGLPAVSGIFSVTHVLSEGEYVWVDGNHGIVRRER